MKTGTLTCGLVCFAILAALLICGCGGAQGGPVSAEEADPYFVNFCSDCVKIGGDMIFLDQYGPGGRRLWTAEASGGAAMPLCGKPECTHDSASCNAFVGGTGDICLAYDSGRLYWIESAGTRCTLYSAEIDGSDRRTEAEPDAALYAKVCGYGTLCIHDGYAYFCGSAERVENGASVFDCAVFRQPLGGGSAEPIYSSTLPAGAVFGRFRGDKLYFAECERLSAYAEEDDEEPTLGYRLFVYDPASGKAEELLHGVNEYDFSYIFTDEDRVVLGGSRPLYYYLETGETRLDDGEGRLDAGVGCGMHWITRSEWEIVSDSGETLFAGSFPLPRMPEAIYGRSYIGCDGGAFYYSFISFSFDKPLSFILRFDTATGEAWIVWQSEG
ncbi:MAG: hypothetical protein II756_00060 [Clostridia bacterium]|nr:hypothetical protein [Clostridia bacterium]